MSKIEVRVQGVIRRRQGYGGTRGYEGSSEVNDGLKVIYSRSQRSEISFRHSREGGNPF